MGIKQLIRNPFHLITELLDELGRANSVITLDLAVCFHKIDFDKHDMTYPKVHFPQ